MTSFSFKNLSSLSFALFPVPIIVKESHLLAFLITPTRLLLPDLCLISQIIQESWLSLTFIFHICFSLQNNILNYRDIFCISFSNQGSIFFMINVYSDLSQLALKYLKDTEVNIPNVIIMTGDFNIRDSIWDSNFPFHLCLSQIRYLLVVILELNSVSEVQYKGMMTDRW